MKKILKRALVGLGCVLLLPILLFGVLFATRAPPDGPRVDASMPASTRTAPCWVRTIQA